MAVPATIGQLRTNISDMQISDYIVCNYTASSGTVGTFSNFGGTVGTEIPITGTATPNGSFYFVKVAKGLLLADRIVQSGVSWDTLNAAKVIQGKPQTFGTVNGFIRCLTGGVAYADANGNKATTDQGYGGWPTNNEWDKYIVNFPTNKIQEGKTLDDVFHWNIETGTWCQETPMITISASTLRIMRGRYKYGGTIYGGLNYLTTSSSNNSWGFRPVFEYKEV